MDSKRKTSVFLLILVFLTSLVLLPQATVKAQATTIVVPSQYPTIQEAIDNAVNGDTILVENGTYQENPINTTKSISLIGDGSQTTIINITCPSFAYTIYGSGISANGIGYSRAISIDADNFTFSGFTVETNGGDISFSGNYTTVANNIIAAPFSANGYYLNITNNDFLKAHFNSGWGVNSDYNLDLSLFISIFSRNTVSYDNNMVGMTIKGEYNVILDNSILGTYLDISCTPCFMSGNTISNELAPFYFASDNSEVTKNVFSDVAYGFGDSGLNNVIFANEITDCGEPYGTPTEHFPLASEGSNESSLFYCNNFIDDSCPLHGIFTDKVDSFDYGTLGNYWSDYNGTASKEGNFGDTPYHLNTTNGTDYYPLLTPFNINTAPDLEPGWAKNLPSIVLALTGNGSSVALTLVGSITSSQMSNIEISADNLSATTAALLSFVVTGPSGTTGFSNITIPISAVNSGTAPSLYIDGYLASNQGYSQDANNFYVWYTTYFSTHEISIQFAKPTVTPIADTQTTNTQTPKGTSNSVPEFQALVCLPLLLIILSTVLIARHRKTANLKQ